MATAQLLRAPQLDYIVYDYLAEVTMTILAKLRARDPQSGYVADFVSDVVSPHLEEVLKRGITLVCNAGGMNPEGLKKKILEVATSKGLSPRVVCVLGDDVSAHPSLQKERKFASANAYLGSPGVAAALATGADIVLTGRVVDTALVLGPLVHEFGWKWDDYEKLSQGSLAGHIIECGTQCTGGNFTGWRDVPGVTDVGFPILQVASDGSFTVSKPPGTGGVVSRASVGEQIVYEISDPYAFQLPDVTCDWSQVILEQVGADRVKVSGARGRAPGPDYKVCATFVDGHKIHATAFIGGGEAVAKARLVGETILKRVTRRLHELALPSFSETLIEAKGGGEEALLRVSAAHPSSEALEILAKEIAPAATSLAPGMTNLLGGRANSVPRVGLQSFLFPKDQAQVRLDDGSEVEIPASVASTRVKTEIITRPTTGPTIEVPLERVASVRSGDKGNDINIGIMAHKPEWLPQLAGLVSATMVADYFKNEFDVPAHRSVHVWDLPGIGALNFLMKDCLGGGGAWSLRLDPQGKAYGQRLGQLKVRVPTNWVEET